MQVVKFGEKINTPISIALGYFDAMHNGHMLLLEGIKGDYPLAVCIMDRHPMSVLLSDKQCLFTLEERLFRLKSLGADYVIILRVDADLLNVSGAEFINQLCDTYEIKKAAIGDDYTCGKGAEFDSQSVRDALKMRGIECDIMPLACDNHNVKISTSMIAELVAAGHTADANELMPLPYLMLGDVVGGRQVGGRQVFPTANMLSPLNKVMPCDGVYASVAEIKGMRYKAITNIGYKPTFSDYTRTVETYILDFSGDIYGEIMVLYVIERIRDIAKFDTPQQLKNQISTDIRAVLANSTIKNMVNNA